MTQLIKIIIIPSVCFLLYPKYSKRSNNFFSPFLCGYRKGYSAQHALLSLLDKWYISLDNKDFGAAILMDLSKGFDTLNHDLLLAKVHAYGFAKSALKLTKSYLSTRLQRTKISQGSVLAPLLFNLFINDLFYLICESDVCNYADDNTLHARRRILIRASFNSHFLIAHLCGCFKVGNWILKSTICITGVLFIWVKHLLLRNIYWRMNLLQCIIKNGIF